MFFFEAFSDARPHGIRAATRKLALLAMTALPLCMAGCKSLSMSDMTASISKPDTALPAAPEDVRRYTQAWEKQYDARPNDKATVMAFARGLRAQGQYAQAVAILQKLALKNPEDLEVLGAYGKALAVAGRLPEAAEALKLLAGLGQSLAGRLQMLDGRDLSWTEMRLQRQSDCPVCSARPNT